MKIIVGTSGRINELLKGVPNEEFMGIVTENGKAWIVLKSDVTPIAAGEVQIKEIIKEVEIEVIKEVIKEVPFDNPELLLKLEEAESIAENRKEQILTLKDALADALNAEESVKKDLIILKGKFTKLKKKFLEEE